MSAKLYIFIYPQIFYVLSPFVAFLISSQMLLALVFLKKDDTPFHFCVLISMFYKSCKSKRSLFLELKYNRYFITCLWTECSSDGWCTCGETSPSRFKSHWLIMSVHIFLNLFKAFRRCVFSMRRSSHWLRRSCMYVSVYICTMFLNKI